MSCVFADADYNQFEIEAEAMTDALKYLEDGMPCEVVFYDGKAISVELPTSVVRGSSSPEPAVKGRYLERGHEAGQDQHRFRTAGSGLRRNRRQDRDRHAY